ncbi:MAG: helix-turn-helix domain-containing protein [Thermoplasmata archaeon]
MTGPRTEAPKSPRRSKPGRRRVPPPFATGADSDRLVMATLRVRVSDERWTGMFTRRHPQVCIEVLNRTDVAPMTSVSDHWISGASPGAWSQEIAGFPDVLGVESVMEMGNGCLYRITFKNPPVVELYRRLQIPLPLPLRIQRGTVGWEVVARAFEFRQILQLARQGDPHARVISIRRGPLRNHLPPLSPAEDDLLTAALNQGYFAVPRECTLPELARRVRKSPSAVSESMAVLEKKLIESALGPIAF